MATSLAQQLQRLAVPQTTLLRQKDKKKASLLFDPKEAATLSKETVFQIATDGFEELKNKNPHFIPFENTLFSTSSKEFERSVQTAEANEKLNRTIKHFLQLLSPYFLQSCAHKALEWLIHRYYVHQYNKDELIMLILPYHETNIFVRVLQLIKIKGNDRWLWLKPLQKPGIHLPKNTLYTHAASNSGFIQFISDNLLCALKEVPDAKVHTILVNFYFVTFMGAIEYAQEISETHITQMLPSILKGLKSENPDFCAAALGISSKLLMKTILSNKLLTKLSERITEINTLTVLRTEAILTLIVLYQSQEQYVTVSPVAVKNMTENAWFTGLLQTLADDGYNVDCLLKPLLKSVIALALDEVSTNCFKVFLEKLLAECSFEEEIIGEVISLILSSYNLETSYSKGTKTWTRELLTRLERQHPNPFDTQISKIMKRTSDQTSTKEQRAFQKIMGETVNGDSLQVQYVLFENLYHPSPEMRKSAVKTLIKNYDALKDRAREFIKNGILDRLKDVDDGVVEETLQLSNIILLKVAGEEDVKSVLVEILRRKNMNAVKAALKILCEITGERDVGAFLGIVRHLLPTSEEGFECVQVIVKSGYLKKIQLKSINAKIAQAETHKEVFDLVYTAITTKKNILIRQSLLDAVKSVPKEDVAGKYFALILLCNCGIDVSLKNNLEVLKIVINVLKDFKTSTKANSPEEYVKLSERKKIPVQGVLESLEFLLQTTASEDLSKVDFYSAPDEYSFYILLLELLLKGVFSEKLAVSKAYAKTIKTFFDHNCADLLTKMCFLMNVAISVNKNVYPTLQLRCVRTVHAIASHEMSGDEIDRKYVDELTPLIIAGLCSDYKEIRSVVIDLSEVLCRAEGDYAAFIKKVVSSREELTMDHDQVCLVMHNVLSSKDKVLNSLVALFCEDTPIYLRRKLVTALSMFKSPEVYGKFAKVATTFLNGDINAEKSAIVKCVIEQFSSEVAADVQLTTDVWTFLETCLKNDSVDIASTYPAILTMAQIDHDVYAQLKPDVQKSLLSIVVNMATYSQKPTLLSAAGKVFKYIDLDALTILDHLIKMRDVQSPKIDPARRKRRIGIIPTVDILDTLQWKEGVTVLEFIQDKKKVSNINKLIPILFDVMKKCLDFDEQAMVEYPKQLILSAILHYCNRLDEIDKPAFNVELIVQCIRASQNPQTHHHALLLLTRVAAFAPEQVLHHIMAIFTFMGSSVLRQDDAYSFQIIEKIIETVIPILVTDGDKSSKVNILRVFVDVILDIPEHRRLPLYRKLLEQIGTEDLNLFLLLIFEAHVTHPSAPATVSAGAGGLKVDATPKRLDIATSLCTYFAYDVIFNSTIKNIQYLSDLPEDPDEPMETDGLFNIKQHTPKQFRHYKYTIVTFTSSLLSAEELVVKVANARKDELAKMEAHFKQMIVGILTFIQTTTKTVEKNVNTPQSQYWKVMLHHCYDILDSVNALLSPQMFLLVINALMTHKMKAVRKRALELLNTKMQHDTDFFRDCTEDELQAILPPLIKIIRQIENEELDSEEDIIIQTALLSLKLFVRLLGPEAPEKFINILQYITNIVIAPDVDDNIRALAILCLSELCTHLKAHAISCLDKFMPSLIKLLRVQKREVTPSLLLMSVLTALLKIFDVLALFLSPYLEKLLCQLSSIGSDLSPTFTQKLTIIKQKIGANLPLRVLLPAITDSFNTLINKKKYPSIKYLMEILSEAISSNQGTELNAHINDLTTLFLNALQFRANNPNCNDEVESHVINALTCLTLKLSENTFRPLYYKLYDWAIRSNTKPDRVITFYALSSALSASLKALFVLFAGHFIHHTATILDACNTNKSSALYFEDESKTATLLEHTLRTLDNVCKYDGQKFINKDRFDILMQPMADQLDNTLTGCEKRARELVIPCIVNFAVAVGDDSLWKQLNYQILLKMRDASASIRLIGLECLRELAKKLGEDFLPLLPETIPFLAELLEDEEEIVEKACQKTVQELEGVLGEPLQKYF